MHLQLRATILTCVCAPRRDSDDLPIRGQPEDAGDAVRDEADVDAVLEVAHDAFLFRPSTSAASSKQFSSFGIRPTAGAMQSGVCLEHRPCNFQAAIWRRACC